MLCRGPAAKLGGSMYSIKKTFIETCLHRKVGRDHDTLKSPFQSIIAAIDASIKKLGPLASWSEQVQAGWMKDFPGCSLLDRVAAARPLQRLVATNGRVGYKVVKRGEYFFSLWLTSSRDPVEMNSNIDCFYTFHSFFVFYSCTWVPP